MPAVSDCAWPYSAVQARIPLFLLSRAAELHDPMRCPSEALADAASETGSSSTPPPRKRAARRSVRSAPVLHAPAASLRQVCPRQSTVPKQPSLASTDPSPQLLCSRPLAFHPNGSIFGRAHEAPQLCSCTYCNEIGVFWNPRMCIT